MPLYNCPRDEHPNLLMSQYLRRPNFYVADTLAMHWDGTYRDRLAGTDPEEFWSDFQYEHFEGPASPRVINAKHLA